MTLNESDRTVLTEALSDLLVFIQNAAPHLKNTSGENIMENTMAIASAKIKLSKLPGDNTLQFTLQELKVMYWALSNLRDDIREFLDSAPPSADERDAALDAEKTCNRLLRFFRNEFLRNGVDIRKMFPHL